MTNPSDTAITLELYKLCVEMADRTSSRRLATNTFFLTLISSLAVIVGVIGSGSDNQVDEKDVVSLVTLSVVGSILSLAWWGLVRYYRRLNSAKFSVINDMELDLPVKPFTEEWARLHPASPSLVRLRWYQVIKRSRRGHREATLMEQIVPIAFAAIYVILGLRALV